MTKKTSCHLPFNVETGDLGMREGTVIKTRISDQLTPRLFGQAAVILTMPCGCVDDELCDQQSAWRGSAGDETVSGS